MTGRAKRTAGGLSLSSRIIGANFGLVLAAVVIALSATPAMATNECLINTTTLGEADRLLQTMRRMPFASVSRGDAIRGLSSESTAQFLTLARKIGGEPINSARIKQQWQEFWTGVTLDGEAMDINALVAFVLREAYMEQNKDLKYYADKVRRANKKKEEIRNKLRSARNQLEALDKGTGASTTRKSLEREIKKWEDALAEDCNDARLANVELQNILQKQQQTLQMMSNISKMLHDTAMAIIRKHG